MLIFAHSFLTFETSLKPLQSKGLCKPCCVQGKEHTKNQKLNSLNI